jgi:hydrogenase nickel incorporation protein HypA/HybF
MHEGAIAAAILQSALEVLEREKIVAAKTVTVLIGRMHSVVPDLLQNHYKIMKKEFPALVRSKLVIEITPVAITCRACGRETALERPEFACPGCFSTDIEISGGREMHLKEITATEAKVKSKKIKGKSKPH